MLFNSSEECYATGFVENMTYRDEQSVLQYKYLLRSISDSTFGIFLPF